MFNGTMDALTKTYKMKANVGENVRIYFGVGGPNLTSSFHVIGEVFDMPGGWKATAFQPSFQRPRWPNISKYCGLAFARRLRVGERGREALTSWKRA